MNISALSDIIDAETDFVSIAIACEDEDAYVKQLNRLGMERNDVIDNKSPHVYTSEDLANGRVTVQYRAGKPESTDTDTDDDEEE